MSCHSLCCRIHFEKEGHKITHTTKQNQPVCAILERFLSVEVSGCSNFSWHVFVLLVSRLVWRSLLTVAEGSVDFLPFEGNHKKLKGKKWKKVDLGELGVQSNKNQCMLYVICSWMKSKVFFNRNFSLNLGNITRRWSEVTKFSEWKGM